MKGCKWKSKRSPSTKISFNLYHYYLVYIFGRLYSGIHVEVSPTKIRHKQWDQESFVPKQPNKNKLGREISELMNFYTIVDLESLQN